MGQGFPIVLVLAALVPLLALIGIFNGLVSARQRARESWSTVDTELQRRHDLIPNLVNAVKGYMQHERVVLERVIALRGEAEQLRPGRPSRRQNEAENELQRALGELTARVEAYPDLKASRNFMALQAELVNTEDRIQSALRYFNANVREFNTRCEMFPGNLIAALFGFRSVEFFELRAAAAREAPAVRVEGDATS